LVGGEGPLSLTGWTVKQKLLREILELLEQVARLGWV